MSHLPRWDLIWTVRAFGRKDCGRLLGAVKRDDAARIGFETNLETSDGAIPADTAVAVEAFVKTTTEAGFRPRTTL